MPKVLILGATGYVGSRLASLLVQNGEHRVYGVTRSEDKAKTLALAEVIPIICDPITNPAPYLDAIREHHIDIVVDVASAHQESSKFIKDIKKVGEERLRSYKDAGLNMASKLGFIYCGGTWSHGDSTKPVNDLHIVGPEEATPPPTLVAWRPGVEKELMACSDVLDVAVVRPALIYGGENGIWTMFLLPLLQAARTGSTETLKIPLQANSRPSLVHVDDVASGFKAVIEKLSLVNGGSTYPVFDLVTSQESMQGIFEAAAAAWGFKGKIELVGAGDNMLAQAMSFTMRGSSDRAKQLLGWQPKRLNGYTLDMDLFAAAFASQY